MENVHILIVDDHKVVREGLKFMLEENEYFQTLLEEVDTEEGAVKRCKVIDYDIVLMDINIGDGSGLCATKKILDFNKEAKIIALSMYDDETNIHNMIKAGVSGYVLKNAGEDELIKAIRTVIAGDKYFSNEVAQTLLDIQNRKKIKIGSKGNRMTITRREKEIITLISEEFTNDEIASKLDISRRTVEGHRKNILLKLGLKNTAGLVRFAVENSLV